MPTEDDVNEAVAMLKAELERNAPAIAAILAEGDEHGYEGNEGTAYGYVGKCSCGWKSVPKQKRRSAQGAVAAHIGHTVAPR